VSVLIVARPGDLAAELARADRTVLLTPPGQVPAERLVVEHQDLTDPPTPAPGWVAP